MQRGQRMKALIVLAHPEPQSFNGALTEAAASTLRMAGHSVTLHDLHAMGFDPVERSDHFSVRANADRFAPQTEQRFSADSDALPADVLECLEAAEAAELVIFQFPLWWYSVPAIMKGWFDRVLVYGRAHTSRKRYDSGPFAGKRAMLSVTVGAPEATFQPDGRNADIEMILWPLNFVLHYVGFTVLQPAVYFSVESGVRYTSDDAVTRRLSAYLTEHAALIGDLDARPAIPFNGWADWTDEGRLTRDAPVHSAFMRRV